jgi:predicted DNA-binding antitoxin AbrB/MazE fold protein
MTSFQANSRTKKSTAELFAKFRAVETCHEAGKAHAHLLAVKDRSREKTVTRSDGHVYGFPSYYYGMSPFYGPHYGMGFGMGINMMRTNTWDETYLFPHINVIYQCADSVAEPEVILREVPPQEMNHLVKDLKGALQVERVLEGSPNAGTLKRGDLILKAEGERLEHNHEVLRLFRNGQREVLIEILREGERRRVQLRAADVTEKVSQTQKEIIAAACDNKDTRERPFCK